MPRSFQNTALSENPFSARRIRPGAIPYLFSHLDDETDVIQLDQLIDDWRKGHFIGQIAGPHGSGKTTLALAIAKRALQTHPLKFNDARSVTIQRSAQTRTSESKSNNIRMPQTGIGVTTTRVEIEGSVNYMESDATSSTGTILIVDGIERLSMMQRILMLRSLASRQIPTLLTVHRVFRGLPLSTRWPVLRRVKTDARALIKIANLLTGPLDQVAASDIEACFKAVSGNCRDALMDLYDFHQLKRLN